MLRGLREKPDPGMLTATPKPQQLDFASLAFDKDRTVLYVGEVAAKWRVSEQHVIDLLEEGKLNGFDVAGRHEYVRVPMSAVQALAKTFRTTPEVVLQIMRNARPECGTGRAFWRIPVKEGFEAFMKENHS